MKEKREERVNEYMDLNEEHRLSEQAMDKLKDYSPSYSEVDIPGEIASSFIESLIEFLLECLFG